MSQFPTELEEHERRRLIECWRFWGRPDQQPPDGPWRTWVLLGGRGAGKTRAGAEWVRNQVNFRGRRRVALIGPTLHDVREVMIEGPSGLRSLPGATTQFQLEKQYEPGAYAYTRPIQKPVEGSVLIACDGVGASAEEYSVDVTTGVVTFEAAPGDGVVITAGFAFDTPVRFDADRFDASLDAFGAGRVLNVPLIEILP